MRLRAGASQGRSGRSGRCLVAWVSPAGPVAYAGFARTVFAMADTDGLTPATVTVEVLLVSVSEAGVLQYRRVERPLFASCSVDETALGAAGLLEVADVWSHSTSWHREPDGSIVLTYAIAPDPSPHLGARPVPLDSPIVDRQASSRPSPDVVPTDAVAQHACRHLAFLLRQGSQQDLPPLPGDLVAALLERAPDVAGKVRTVSVRSRSASRGQ